MGICKCKNIVIMIIGLSSVCVSDLLSTCLPSWFSRHDGVGLMIGLHDLSILFQTFQRIKDHEGFKMRQSATN